MADFNRRQAIGGAAALLMVAAAPPPRDTGLVLADGRAVPLRLWPAAGKTHGFMVFSHGANSRPDKYDRLASAWAAAGWTVIAPLHADSPDHPGGGKIDPALGIPLRLADMRGIITARAALGLPDGPVIAAGHSYGALIAQIMGGAGLEAPGVPDPDVAAIIAFSPPGPFPPRIPATAWASVARPMFVETGTGDVLPMMAPTWQVHRASYDTAPGPAALFVGDGVDHYFGNIICRPERSEAPQTAQFDAALATSLAFLRLALAGKSLAPLRRAGASWVETK